jgi:hypothetical protein
MRLREGDMGETYVGSGSCDIDVVSTNTHIRSFYSILFQL